MSGFTTVGLADGWITGAGLNTVYQGFEGVIYQNIQGNTGITPERTIEWETGIDLAFFNNAVNLGVTYYKSKTKAAILNLPIPQSTGFAQIAENGASWRNWGWEVALDWLTVRQRDFSWRLTANWATNNSNVDSLLGAESVFLSGFAGTSSRVTQGSPFPILWGNDWIRFGRGLTVGGVDIDNTYTGWSEDDLYICGAGDPGCSTPGMPLEDPQKRVIGDPNPDWTGSLRSTFTFFGNLRLSGLLDIKQGGQHNACTRRPRRCTVRVSTRPSRAWGRVPVRRSHSTGTPGPSTVPAVASRDPGSSSSRTRGS